MLKASKDERGFTYLEAMIVVIILGLFSAMALPAFENIVAQERLKSTARAITVHLREVQQLAIAKEETIKIVFTAGTFNDGTDLGSYYLVQSGSVILERKTLPDDILIEAVSFRDEINDGVEIHTILNFYPLGTANPGRIMLKNRRGDEFYVIVNSVGRVRTSNVPPK